MYQPNYAITQKILRLTGSIDAAREVIDNAALVPAWEKNFRAEAMRKTVYHGTHLEGNELSKEQAERVMLLNETHAEQAAIKAQIVGRNRDVQEVINYRRVMRWIEEHGHKAHIDFKLDEKLLNAIHELTVFRILPEDQRGNFRNQEVVLRNSQTQEVTFRPPPAIEVPYLIEAFFEWLNSDEGKEHHPILRAGIAQYELVRIHPFTDGNGRAARALALMILYSEGYDIKRFFSLEEHFDSNPSAYYTALQSASNDPELNMTGWLEFFSESLAIELDKVKQTVVKMSKDMELKSRMGNQIALTQRQIKILELMRRNNKRAVSADLQQILPDVSLDTILRDIKDMMDKNLMVKRGRTKGAYYELLE